MRSLFTLAIFISSVVHADDTTRLTALLAKGGTVTIPAGDYHLPSTTSIPLVSNTTVFAHGARFILPEAGGTYDILFRDVKSNGMASAVIGVHA
jgi:hypothetical protein